jgi:hypothetical protein
MVSGCRAATIVRASPGYRERVRGVVVAGAANDHTSGCPRVRLPIAVGSISIGAEDAERPLAKIAEHVLDTVGARAVRPTAGGLGGVVGAAEDCQVGCGRCRAPRIQASIIAAGGLLPLRLGGKAAALPRTVIAGAEPGDLDDGMMLESRIGDPSPVGPVDASVGVVLVVAALAAWRAEAGRVQKGRTRSSSPCGARARSRARRRGAAVPRPAVRRRGPSRRRRLGPA